MKRCICLLLLNKTQGKIILTRFLWYSKCQSTSIYHNWDTSKALKEEKIKLHCYSPQPINAQILWTEILYRLSFNSSEAIVTQKGKRSCLKLPKKQLAKAGNKFNTLKLHIILNMNKVLHYKCIENLLVALVIVTTIYSISVYM